MPRPVSSSRPGRSDGRSRCIVAVSSAGASNPSRAWRKSPGPCRWWRRRRCARRNRRLSPHAPLHCCCTESSARRRRGWATSRIHCYRCARCARGPSSWSDLAQQAAIAPRPFTLLLYRIQRAATTRLGDFTDPLLQVREVRTRAVILVRSGATGGYRPTPLYTAAVPNPARGDDAAGRLHGSTATGARGAHAGRHPGPIWRNRRLSPHAPLHCCCTESSARRRRGWATSRIHCYRCARCARGPSSWSDLAQQAAIAPRPFTLLLYRIQRAATTRLGDFTDPLLQVREVRTRAVILV